MRGKAETTVGLLVLGALAIFAYMGFQIGAFRFNRSRYNEYPMLFKDISGLARKAEVKIAGVKVGWVEEVILRPDQETKAEARVMILNDYKLYKNAHAMVRQDGLLGPKYVEVVPGDPLLPDLAAGSTIAKPNVEPVSIDDLLQQFKDIASHVQEVTHSFREVVGGEHGQMQLKSMFETMKEAIDRFASLTEVVDRALNRNEDNIDTFLSIGQEIKAISERLDKQILPAFHSSITRIADVFDRDFDRIAGEMKSATGALEQASLQARDGFENINSITEKLNEGHGLLGKLINEDETYADIKIALEGLKNYVAKIDTMQFVFDSHVESMHRPAENYEFEDAKGYFGVRIYPSEDRFYLIELVTSEKGWVDRWEIHKAYEDTDGHPVNANKQIIGDPRINRLQLDFIYREKRERYIRNTVKLGLQFGKIFGDIAVRFGLFEGTAGIGVDFDIPLCSDRYRWVTSLEMFDFRGWNRKDDRRPHLKWLNRMFILRNIYMTFGADDFVSKRNANAFFGAGIRFGDDDLKFLLSNVGTGCVTSSLR